MTYKQLVEKLTRKLKKELNRIFKNNSKATLKDIRLLIDDIVRHDVLVKSKFSKLYLFQQEEYKTLVKLLNTNQGRKMVSDCREEYQEENWIEFYY
jgi:SUMO ligase MMS21 Smc5/6 complex component